MAGMSKLASSYAKRELPPFTLYQAEKYRGALWREAARKHAGLCRMYFLVRM